MAKGTATKHGGAGATEHGRHGGRPLRALARLILAVGKRSYAVVVIAVTAWLSYMAFRYLIVTLMFPSAAPVQITGIPTRLDRALLETRRTEWPGVQVGENPRVPPAHYHHVRGWIRPDPHNDCIRSGCHAPLPHSKRKELRAFLNMHATSLHCSVCHLQSERTPLDLVWYDLSAGEASEAPALLQAYDLLTSDEGRARLAHPTAADQSDLAELLSAAARASDGVPALVELARHIASVAPTSEAFGQLIEAARTTLPRHFRGEYGVKLTLRDPATGEPLLGHPKEPGRDGPAPNTAEAVREFLRRGAALPSAEREALLARVHPLRRPQTLHCTECHRAEGSLVDLEKVGYPAARRESLTQPVVFQMIENIGEGRPMRLLQLPGAE